MKKFWIVTVVAITVIVACCAGGRLLLPDFVEATFPHPHDSPAYVLDVDGDRLYVHSAYGNEHWEFDVVAGKTGQIHTSYDHENPSFVLTIDDGASKIVKHGNLFDSPVWSAQSNAGYFVKSNDDGSVYSFVRWTKKDGFKTIFETKNNLGKARESLDGKYITVEADKGNHEPGSEYIYIVSTATLQFTTLPIGDIHSILMVSEGKYLVADWNPYLWIPKTKEKRVLFHDLGVQEFVAYHGRAWCVLGESAVRLDPSLTTADMTVPFSAAFIKKSNEPPKPE